MACSTSGRRVTKAPTPIAVPAPSTRMTHSAATSSRCAQPDNFQRAACGTSYMPILSRGVRPRPASRLGNVLPPEPSVRNATANGRGHAGRREGWVSIAFS